MPVIPKIISINITYIQILIVTQIKLLIKPCVISLILLYIMLLKLSRLGFWNSY